LEHPFLASVNSQQWRFVCKDRRDPSSGFWSYTPYACIGLLIEGGASKVKNDSKVHDLSAVWNKLRPTMWSQKFAMKRFLRIHMEEIRHITKDGLLNLFASPQNGGVGMDIPVDDGIPWEFSYTRLQRALAYSRNLRNEGRIVSRPARGGIELKFKNQNGDVFPYTHPNQDLHKKSSCYLACRKEPDGEVVLSSEDYHDNSKLFEPIVDDPEDGRTNCSLKRLLFFNKYRNDKGLEVERTWKLPRWTDIKKLVTRRTPWRDSELATEIDMKTELSYVPVRKIEIPVA
jgi:hypothetical protein